MAWSRVVGLRKIGGLATARKQSKKPDPLAPFGPAVRRWFEASFEGPTPAQAGGWEAISGGDNALICAPTGSGKTLASFLWGIDRLARATEQGRAPLGTGVRLVYVSPLKALSYDIERNLRAPLRGIGAAKLAVGLRTGDTSQAERRAKKKTPPDILITTPESLYLMLSSSVREILATTQAVIVDEIHAVAQSKRGSHLALTLERLEHLVGEPVQRIGLSATQRPLDRIAKFLVGPKRECEIVDAGVAKELDLEIVVPVEDMAEPGAPNFPNSEGVPAEGEPLAHVRSIWPAIYPKLLELVQEHTSTIIFVNARRAAERLAKRLNELANGESVPGELPATEHGGHAGSDGVGPAGTPREVAPDGPTPSGPVEIARAHHGSLSHEERLVVEEMLKSGQLPCLVATS